MDGFVAEARFVVGTEMGMTVGETTELAALDDDTGDADRGEGGTVTEDTAASGTVEGARRGTDEEGVAEGCDDVRRLLLRGRVGAVDMGDVSLAAVDDRVTRRVSVTGTGARVGRVAVGLVVMGEEEEGEEVVEG